MPARDDELEIFEEQLPDGTLRIALRGELDMIGAPEVEERLAQLAGEGQDVRLDLSELTFMDSTGVKVLFAATKALGTDGPRLEIVRPQGSVWRVIELTGLQRVLPFLDEDGDAAASDQASG
jgi:anti-anti-sigma factor